MSEPSLEPFEARAEALLSRVFRGMHHVHSLKKNARYWTCLNYGDASSQDFDLLTRLVFAAHEYCCRVSISNGGPRTLKVWVHSRDRSDSYTNGHRTIEQALARWNDGL